MHPIRKVWSIFPSASLSLNLIQRMVYSLQHSSMHRVGTLLPTHWMTIYKQAFILKISSSYLQLHLHLHLHLHSKSISHLFHLHRAVHKYPALSQVEYRKWLKDCTNWKIKERKGKTTKCCYEAFLHMRC